MSNARKSVFISACSVAVAILLLGYSAYGWMTVSREVRAVGQNLSVDAPNNLEIALSADGPWAGTVTVPLSEIVQTLTENDETKFDAESDSKFFLLPASSYNGTDNTMWQTGVATGVLDTTVFSKGHRVQWNTDMKAFEGHWVDVPLYFRTQSGKALTAGLQQDECTVTTAGKEPGILNVVRAAFLSEDTTKSADGTDTPLVFEKNAQTVTVVTGATDTTVPAYLEFTDGKTKKIFTVPADGSACCIVVRIWAEGQDSNCVAKIGGQAFDLSLGFTVIDE